MNSSQPAKPPAVPQRDEQAAASSSKNRKSQRTAAIPGPGKSKDKPILTRPSAAKIARAAQLKPAKKAQSRPKAHAAKKTSKVKSARKASRKAIAGSKQDGVIALLRRPEGASIDVLVKTTGWQPHSVRGFLAGTVRKKLKLPLQSQKVDGKRTYRIKAGKPSAKTGKSRPV
jgi:Protein of unknown function (DUF3489)